MCPLCCHFSLQMKTSAIVQRLSVAEGVCKELLALRVQKVAKLDAMEASSKTLEAELHALSQMSSMKVRPSVPSLPLLLFPLCCCSVNIACVSRCHVVMVRSGEGHASLALRAAAICLHTARMPASSGCPPAAAL